MFKKLIYLVIFLFIAIAASLFYVNGINGEQQNKDISHPSSQEPIEEEDPAHSNENSKALIEEIISMSKQGKLPHIPFIAGKTEIQEVNEKWGEPKQINKISNKNYADYTEQMGTIGYQNQTIFDIRSFHNVLQTIHFNDIEQTQGVPDEIRYYKDESHNQIILVYHVNEQYDLKWILPKPSEHEPNPKVHHISVFTEIINRDDHYVSISDMSIDEKIGQMILAGISGTTLNANTKSLISQYKVGGIIAYKENVENPTQTAQLLNSLKTENAKNRIPLFLSIDQEGGDISRLPGNLLDLPTNHQIGRINNSTFSFEIGTLLGKEVKGFGFNLNYAPVLDVNSNPNNPIIGNRSFGNSPEIVSKLGIQTMKGIQSQNVIPVIKHFPGHGDTSVDSHLELPKVNKSLKDLEQLELIPFKKAIEGGTDVVMVAHILLPKIDATYPASISKNIITGILRNQLDFTGVVITDDMTMDAIEKNYDLGEAAVQSVKAGSDIIMVAHDYNKIVKVIHALKLAVANGEISEERIDESVHRIIQLKRKYNLDQGKVNGVNIGELNHAIERVLNKYMD